MYYLIVYIDGLKFQRHILTNSDFWIPSYQITYTIDK